MKPRLLVTGASGFLGGHLCRAALPDWEVAGTFHTHPIAVAGVHALHVDLADERALREVLAQVDPEAVIHTAVLQVDACEQDPTAAQVLNVEVPRRLAAWCARQQRRMMHVSSDLVFDGGKGMYTEADEARPVMLYGCTKLAGENAVLAEYPSACVVRLPLMYGFPFGQGVSFFVSTLQRLQRGEAVTVFHDQYRTPGLVDNMARAVLELATSACAGRLHVAGAQRCSRWEMARVLCRLAGCDESLLHVVSMHEVRLAAPRPQDVSLDCRQARRLLQTPLLEVEAGMRLLLRHNHGR